MDLLCESCSRASDLFIASILMNNNNNNDHKTKNCLPPFDVSYKIDLDLEIGDFNFVLPSWHTFTLLFMLWIISFIWFNRIAAFPPRSN